MVVLKTVFLVVAIIAVPLLCLFLIRLTFKLGRVMDHLNRTLEDARPQLNLLLVSLNHTMEEINQELEALGRMTDDAQRMIAGMESSLLAVEKALRSPWARWGGTLAAIATGRSLLRRVLRVRSESETG